MLIKNTMGLLKFLLPAFLFGAFFSYILSSYLFLIYANDRYHSGTPNNQNFLIPMCFFVFLTSLFCIYRFTLIDQVAVKVKRVIGATLRHLFIEFVLDLLLICLIWLLIACPLLVVIVVSGRTIVVYSEVIVSVLQFLFFSIYYLFFLKWELGHNEI